MLCVSALLLHGALGTSPGSGRPGAAAAAIHGPGRPIEALLRARSIASVAENKRTNGKCYRYFQRRRLMDRRM
jgi:hypothetical protein